MTTHGRSIATVIVLGGSLAVAAFGGQSRTDAPTQAAKGTAVITGTVVCDTAPAQPVARALVTITATGRGDRSAFTDATGSFTIRDLPEGRFTVTAARPGYVTGSYGAKRPGRPGTPVSVSAGQTQSLTIHIARGAVVAGTIRDASGERVGNALVFALNTQSDISTATESLMTTSRGHATPGGLTDDRGRYRIFGLTPGEYVILATGGDTQNSAQISRRRDEEIDAIFRRLRAHQAAVPSRDGAVVGDRAGDPPHFTLAPIYYPGTPSLAAAARVTLGFGDERAALDFTMTPVPVTTIDGTVVNEDGRTPANVEIDVEPENRIYLFALTSTPAVSHAPAAAGHFHISNLTPGHYTLTARASATSPASFGGRSIGAFAANDTGTTYGLASVDVGGDPISGLTITLRPGGRFAGQVTFDRATEPIPDDLTKLRVRLVPTAGSGFTLTAVQADGTFDLMGLAPGTYRVQVSVGTWWLRSAMVGDVDVLDRGLEIGPGTDATRATLILTDKHSQLSGRLQTAGGTPAPDFSVIVFPADATLRSVARRVQATRPSTDGVFEFKDLPAGDYLLAAVTDVEPDEWKKTSFLNSIASAGVKVTLRPSEKKTQDLTIVPKF